MNAQEARVEAQAKLNLLLRILGREDSGYHQIETLFCRICLSDTVTVRVTPRDRSLLCHGERVPAGGLGPPEKNLAWRAAAAYAAATGFPTGFQITIEKRIPVAAGLGGGSADAGAVLRALNALNARPVPPATLQQIASSLGADVPFLTLDDATLALAWGRGDRLAALPGLPASAVWLLVPDATVNTAEAYRWFDEAGSPPGESVISRAQFGSWEGVASVAANDFEAVVGERIPRIGRLLATLRSDELKELLGPSGSILMSGSGSTIAVISGQPRAPHMSAIPPFAGVTVIETETSTFVEPVVLTH
jgi:4-diphosphocytidyl-2-C-methyl-D-erythritol kinase